MDIFENILRRINSSNVGNFDTGMADILEYIKQMERDIALVKKEAQHNLWDETDLIDTKVNTYDLGKVIGSGSMGDVCAINDTSDSDEGQLAMKLVKKFWKKQKFKMVQCEIKNLRLIDHRNVIKLYNVCDLGNSFIGLCLDRYECDLYSVIYKQSQHANINTTYILSEILKGISYIHSLGISHCDIKSENILVKNQINDIVLTDFGLSTNEQHVSLFRGSLGFIAPEIFYSQDSSFNAQSYSTQKADLFAFGCVALELEIKSLEEFDKWIIPRSYLGKNNIQFVTKTMKQNIDTMRELYQKNEFIANVLHFKPCDRNIRFSSLLNSMPCKKKRITFEINQSFDGDVCKDLNIWEVTHPLPAIEACIDLVNHNGYFLVHCNTKQFEEFVATINECEWIFGVRFELCNFETLWSGWKISISEKQLSPKVVMNTRGIFDYGSNAKLLSFSEDMSFSDIHENQEIEYNRLENPKEKIVLKSNRNMVQCFGKVLKIASNKDIIIEEKRVARRAVGVGTPSSLTTQSI